MCGVKTEVVSTPQASMLISLKKSVLKNSAPELLDIYLLRELNWPLLTLVETT